MATLDLVARLSHDLDTREAVVRTWEARYAGDVPLSFIPPRTRAKLGDRLSSLKINFCALATDALAERLRLTGFAVDGQPDTDLWERFTRAGMDVGTQQVHLDALATGEAFASVWAVAGQPQPMPEHPSQVIARRDPLTRSVTAALKRWSADGRAYAVLYEPHSISTLTSRATVPEGGVYSIGSIPADGWTVTGSIPNPLGVVPVVPFVNAGRLTSPHGVSAMEPIADLNDAVIKILVDMLVTSESSAQPRRWATGIELDVETLEDGTEVVHDPWEGRTTTAQSESPESKFGQFAPSDLSAYKTAAELLIRQIGALSGLSPQMLGMNADQAMSADAIRAAEATLTARAESRQKVFGRSWAQVAALMLAVRDGVDPRRVNVTPVWADPATRSDAQASDGAAKLYGSGLLSRAGALSRLGFTPEQVQQELRQSAGEAATALLAGGVQ